MVFAWQSIHEEIITNFEGIKQARIILPSAMREIRETRNGIVPAGVRDVVNKEREGRIVVYLWWKSVIEILGNKKHENGLCCPLIETETILIANR